MPRHLEQCLRGPGPGLKPDHLGLNCGLRCGLPGLARLAAPGMAVDNFETEADTTISVAGFPLQPLA